MAEQQQPQGVPLDTRLLLANPANAATAALAAAPPPANEAPSTTTAATRPAAPSAGAPQTADPLSLPPIPHVDGKVLLRCSLCHNPGKRRFADFPRLALYKSHLTRDHKQADWFSLPPPVCVNTGRRVAIDWDNKYHKKWLLQRGVALGSPGRPPPPPPPPPGGTVVGDTSAYTLPAYPLLPSAKPLPPVTQRNLKDGWNEHDVDALLSADAQRIALNGLLKPVDFTHDRLVEAHASVVITMGNLFKRNDKRHQEAAYLLSYLLPFMALCPDPDGPPDYTKLNEQLVRAASGDWRALLEEFWARHQVLRKHKPLAGAVAPQPSTNPAPTRPTAVPASTSAPTPSAMANRFLATLGDEIANKENMPPHLPPPPPFPPPPQQQPPQEQAEQKRLEGNKRRGLAQFRVGQLGKAAAATFSDEAAAPATDDTLRKLQLLHPEPRHSIPDELRQRVEAYVPDKPLSITDTMLFTAAAGMARKSAGGASGTCCDQMRKALLDKPQARDAVRLLVQGLARGDVSERVAELYGDCVLVAIAKPASPGKPRPISMGEFLRRLAARCLADAHKARMEEFLLPHQLGAGASCGVEVNGKSIQATLDLNPDEYGAIKADVSNAFNVVDRAEMFSLLLQHKEKFGHLIPVRSPFLPPRRTPLLPHGRRLVPHCPVPHRLPARRPHRHLPVLPLHPLRVGEPQGGGRDSRVRHRRRHHRCRPLAGASGPVQHAALRPARGGLRARNFRAQDDRPRARGPRAHPRRTARRARCRLPP